MLAFNTIIIAFDFNFGTFIPLWLPTGRGCCFYNRQEITRHRFLFSWALLPCPKSRGTGWHRVSMLLGTHIGPFTLIAVDNFCVV